MEYRAEFERACCLLGFILEIDATPFELVTCILQQGRSRNRSLRRWTGIVRRRSHVNSLILRRFYDLFRNIAETQQQVSGFYRVSRCPATLPTALHLGFPTYTGLTSTGGECN